MNKLQKMIVALLMLGALPGAVLAMDDAKGVFNPEEWRHINKKKVDLGGDLKVGETVAIPAEIVAEAADNPLSGISATTDQGQPPLLEDTTDDDLFDYAPEDIPAIVPGPIPAPNPLVDTGVLGNPASKQVVEPAVDPLLLETPLVRCDQPDILPESTPDFTQVLLKKIQPLMTKTGLFGLTGLITGVIGLRYAYVSSVIKQVADLQILRSQCDATLDAVLQGETDPDLVEIPSIVCVGLHEELQDKLDDALAGYNIALQQLCHELCAKNGQMVDSIQEQQARKAVTACQAVIDECEQVLVKKPTMMDTAIKKGSILAQALTTQVKATATTLASRFKRQDPKKA